MSVEEASELARRAIYHATFRDGASGGVASGILSYFPIDKLYLSAYDILLLSHTWIRNCKHTRMYF